MCIMTLVDIDKEKLPELHNSVTLRRLFILNQLLGNDDGFGFYLFHNKQLVKTKDTSSLYFYKNYTQQFSRYNSYNGIYHVRKASGVNQVNYDEIVKDSNSHPFISNNIVVTHNGSLTPRERHIDFGKYKDILNSKDIIDSEKFTKILGSISEENNGITLEGINKAINFFGGPFCFFIHDKKVPDFVWIIRGKQRFLYKLTILDDKGNPVGTIINSSILPLTLLKSELYPMTVELAELNNETAFSYMLGSYRLKEGGKVEENSSYEVKQVSFPPRKKQEVHHVSTSKKSDKKYIDSSWEPYVILISVLNESALSMKEVAYLYYLIFSKSIMLATEQELTFFSEFVEILHNDFYEGRRERWMKILNKYSKKPRLYLYDILGLEFPYFLNSNSKLGRTLNAAYSPNKNNIVKLDDKTSDSTSGANLIDKDGFVQ